MNRARCARPPLSLWLGLALLAQGLTACSAPNDVDLPNAEESDPAEDIGPSAEDAPGAVVAVEAFAHDASAPAVTAFWSRPPASVEAWDSLTMVLESHADGPKTVTPAVLVAGVDDRSVYVEFDPVELGSGETAEVEISLLDLPLQSRTHSVSMVASVSYDGAFVGDRITVQAETLAFHFEDDAYHKPVVYTLDTMVMQLSGGQIAADPRTVDARVLDGGAWTSVTNDPVLGDPLFVPAEASVAFTYEVGDSPTSTFDGFAATTAPQSAPGLPGPGTTPNPGGGPTAAYCALQPWNCCTGTNCRDVCTDWTTTFVDSSDYGDTTKEDYALGSGTQLVDASYAEYRVTRLQCGAIYCSHQNVKTGVLGPDGCAQVDMPSGSGYTMRVKTRLDYAGKTYPVEYFPTNDDASNVGVVEVSKAFTVYPSGSPLPPPMVVLPTHAATNAAATLSRAFLAGVMTDQSSAFPIYAGLGCLGQAGIPSTDACAGDIVKTGPYNKPGGVPGHLRSKFVLAHEIGHTVQGKAMGRIAYPYCFSANGNAIACGAAGALPDHPNAPDACSCDHVTGSNQLHCLQSFERSSAAQLEGYAQFFSARVWNNPDNSCSFSYYKQFLDDDDVVHQPPYKVSCSTPANWRDEHCFASWGGTEYDWFQFFWYLHAVDVAKYSIHDIYEVYRGACDGAPCNGQEVSWDDLYDSAEAYFGSASPEFFKLIAGGYLTGVDTQK